ncbi:MAG: HAD-superfamily hydrolase, subfamily variant 1 [Deltaproteobacteria bacterium]|nr:HAD-superfamily hydrolase, subfamily variant 1 [Deltaproteobacteria bacterium]
MKKVISFDLDGTLVDARYGDMVWNHGIPEEYAKAYGMTFDDARAYIRTQYESVGDGDILWYEIRHWLTRFSLDVAADETGIPSLLRPTPPGYLSKKSSSVPG